MFKEGDIWLLKFNGGLWHYLILEKHGFIWNSILLEEGTQITLSAVGKPDPNYWCKVA